MYGKIQKGAFMHLLILVIFTNTCFAAPVKNSESNNKPKFRRRYPVWEAYTMSNDDFNEFNQNLENKIVGCDIDEFLSFDSNECEPCRKICEPPTVSWKKCQRWCPDAYAAHKVSSPILIYVGLGLGGISIFLWLIAVIYICKQFSYEPEPKAEYPDEKQPLTKPTKKDEDTGPPTPTKKSPDVIPTYNKPMIPADRDTPATVVTGTGHPVPESIRNSF